MTSTAVASHKPYLPEPGLRPAPDAVTDVAMADRQAAATLLAEVVAHRGAETPLALGVFGPAGSGKSRFLSAVADRVERLAEAASAMGQGGGGAASAGPFASRVVLARVSAAPGREPAALLAGGVITALAERHANFVEDAIHAGGDPREAARLAGERVNALRRSLDAERQALDALEDRRARLTDTVLFHSAGSRVDGFARANRGRIEARLRGFGLPAADPIRTYKEWVRDHAEPAGGGARLGLALRALWGFKGQGALLAVAVVLAVVGGVTGAGADNPDAAAAWLGGLGDHFAALADWGRAHLGLLDPVSRIAWALVAIALLADVVRAARFLGPVFKGITLLRGELDGRRRDLDGLLAHQTRRVDALAAEAETAGQHADVAQRRADGRSGPGLSDGGAALADQRYGLSLSGEAAAERLFAELSHGMGQGGEAMPERILVVVDGLDRLSPPEAAAFLGTAQSLLGRPGFVTLVALEREQAATALGEFDPAQVAARLNRTFQLSYDLGTVPVDASALAANLLGGGAARDPERSISVDASRSALDRPLQRFETELVTTLAPLADGTPRAVKRFVQSYRVARADLRLGRQAPAALGALALALALDGTGAGSEIAAFDDDLARGRMAVDENTAFGQAFDAMVAIVGGDAGGADLRRGFAVARSFSRRG